MDTGKGQDINSPAAFKKLFMEYAEPLRNFLWYKTGDVQQAEDLAQEAFVRLWNNREKIDATKAKSYLYTVANNLFLDAKRHEKVRLKFQAVKPEDTNKESPLFLLEEAEFKEKLEQTISDMPEKSREVFLMNRIEELSYKEIAQRLEISVKAVEKRMSKALLSLRRLKRKI